jgi:uncharacterized membrane protein
MAVEYSLPARRSILSPLYAALLSFPIACFTLALFTDIAYSQTSNLLWLHFSEWLLLAGLVGGILAMIARGLEYLAWKTRPRWSAVFAGFLVLLLAAINNFVHTADGWTAIVAYGLLLSIATVLMMIATAWLALAGMRHE